MRGMDGERNCLSASSGSSEPFLGLNWPDHVTFYCQSFYGTFLSATEYGHQPRPICKASANVAPIKAVQMVKKHEKASQHRPESSLSNQMLEGLEVRPDMAAVPWAD